MFQSFANELQGKARVWKCPSKLSGWPNQHGAILITPQSNTVQFTPNLWPSAAAVWKVRSAAPFWRLCKTLQNGGTGSQNLGLVVNTAEQMTSAEPSDFSLYIKKQLVKHTFPAEGKRAKVKVPAILNAFVCADTKRIWGLLQLIIVDKGQDA